MKLSLIIPILVSLCVHFSVHAELSFSGDIISYLTETERSEQENWYYSLKSIYKKESFLLGKKSYVFLGAELTLNDIESSQVFIPEAYIKGEKNWWLGRKVVGKFKYEDVWDLSFINPYYRKDFLNPIKQGVFGFHYEYALSTKVKLGAVISPIYFPDQGPKVNEDNGTLYSSNRWFGGQISEITLGNGATSVVKYDLETPKLDDVFLNPGVLLTADYQWSETLSLNTLYAYKPMNQFHLAADIILDSSLSGNFNTLSEVQVAVPYHNLSVIELAYNDKKLLMWADAVFERPKRPKLEAKLFEANLEDRDQYHLGFRYRVFPEFLLSLSYLKAKIKKLNDEPKTVTVNNAELNINRHFYDEALIIKAYKKINNFDIEASYLYSFLEKGGMGSLKITKAFSRKAEAYFSFVVVGVDREVQNAFFTPLRDNDLLQLGVRYVL